MMHSILFPICIWIVLAFVPLLTTGDTGLITAYGWCDNDPPGDAISSSGRYGKAVQGDGSYDNPSTCATDPSRIGFGTVIYLPHLKKYCVVEDTCAACQSDSGTHVDLWIGINGSPDCGAESNCEDSVTREHAQIYINAPDGLEVDTTPIFNGWNCQY